MKRVFIVQARMTSTRLPGKVLMDLDGKPMLAQQLNRLKRCRTADEIVVACTTNTEDDPIAALCAREHVMIFRGSEKDVLSRYLGAARMAKADLVIRITSDCPLICPEICDMVVNSIGDADYASNALRRTYPRGLDTEIFTFAALERAAAEATSPPSREHVTWRFHTEDSASYTLRSVEDAENHSNLRWTVDETDDIEMVRQIWTRLRLSEETLGYREILAYCLAHPEITAINAAIEQKKF
jgi:spore coat polysaccharide biosynthesis protein SpsF